jgi:hypothetical protein
MGTNRETLSRDAFLRRIRDAGHRVDENHVIAREGVYVVDNNVNLLVRTSRYHPGKKTYFFGLTHHVFANFADLPNSIIAFVFSDTGQAALLPAKWLWDRRAKLSASSKQLKVVIDKSPALKVIANAGPAIDLSPFVDDFQLMSNVLSEEPKREQSLESRVSHAQVQWALLEIGNRRGFQTYCADPARQYKRRKLGELMTVQEIPEFPGINNKIVRNIDVIWYDRSFPAHAFEVELTTGIWSGLVRLAELQRLNTVFHVVTPNDDRSFRRRISGDIFRPLVERCHHASTAEILHLHETERKLAEIRERLHLQQGPGS